jgi:ketosteroid isomerase-like protein
VRDDDGRRYAEVATRAGSPATRLESFIRAINQHDLDALLACFAPEFVSETPAHPDRSFRGREQVRTNWTQIFAAVPDLHAILVRCAVDGERVWAEWDWTGTRADGSDFAMRGVTILSVHEDRFTSVRFYMEPVQRGGPGPDAAIRQVVGSAASA